MSHPRWHADCNWEERDEPGNKPWMNSFNHSWCIDHKVFFCRCGWEWGWHGGERTDKPVREWSYKRSWLD